MRHNQTIDLISVTSAVDANGLPVTDTVGNPVTVVTERQVYANEMSVGLAEFYNAALAGLRPTKRFEIYSWEYQLETKLKHADTVYRITRVESKGEKARLTCESVGADGN